MCVDVSGGGGRGGEQRDAGVIRTSTAGVVCGCSDAAIYSAPDFCQRLFINLQAASAKRKLTR